MRKRILAILLMLSMLLAVMPVGAMAVDDETTDAYAGLTWNFQDGVLTIGGNGEIGDGSYEYIGGPSDLYNDYRPWKEHLADIEKIVIQEGITRIGSSAFRDCTETSVELPESLVEIAEQAFAGNSKLSTIKFPGSLKKIGKNVFSGCGFEQIDIPATLTDIDENAFSGSLLKSVTIHGDRALPYGVFQYCLSLTDVYCDGLVTFAKEEIIDTYVYYCVFKYSNEDNGGVTVHYPVGNEAAAACMAEESAKHETCGTCQLTWKQDYEPPKKDPCAEGHSFTEHKVLKESTTTTHGSIEYTCTVCKKTVTEELPLNTFSDIKLTKDTEWYYAPTLWAVENHITDGMNPNAAEFVPEGLCTRAQVVTFLWRAAGRPEPKSTTNPFVDVKDTEHTNWYYKAVLWAVENGITTGTDATHFSPEVVCNRAMVATFIWRSNGKPAPASTASSFSDVKDSKEYYYHAVLWATENSVINGMGDGTFAPMADCQRAHVVAMLYRDAMR